MSIHKQFDTSDYILLQQQETSGNDDSTTKGTLITRNINTEVEDNGGHCTLSSNQFTLVAGTYRVNAIAQAYRSGRHQAELYNVSDTSAEITGTNAFSDNAAGYAVTESYIRGVFTITAVKTFSIRHYANSTSNLKYGLAVSRGTEKYLTVELWKVG